MGIWGPSKLVRLYFKFEGRYCVKSLKTFFQDNKFDKKMRHHIPKKKKKKKKKKKEKEKKKWL